MSNLTTIILFKTTSDDFCPTLMRGYIQTLPGHINFNCYTEVSQRIHRVTQRKNPDISLILFNSKPLTLFSRLSLSPGLYVKSTNLTVTQSLSLFVPPSLNLSVPQSLSLLSVGRSLYHIQTGREASFLYNTPTSTMLSPPASPAVAFFDNRNIGEGCSVRFKISDLRFSILDFSLEKWSFTCSGVNHESQITNQKT